MLGKLAVAIAATLATVTTAPAIDLHQFWDGRCQECHGHAGAFARRDLTVKDGRLVGRHQTDLRRFLAQHEAGPAQADAIYSMLLAQAVTPPVYQQKCAGCHQTAAELARTALAVRNGVVVGRDSGRPLGELLTRHGKLSPQEIPVVVESLTRVLGEVGAVPPG